MIKAIFLDVDGTLFSHTIHGIPASARSALAEIRRRGTLVFIASGRHPLALRRLNLGDFPYDGYVTLTGHLCYDGAWRPVSRTPLPEADTRLLVRAFNEHRYPIALFHEDDAYMNYADDLVLRMMAAVSSPPPPLSEYLGKPVYSGALYVPREEAERFAAQLPGCRLSAWHPSGFDIISRGVGKVRGIEAVMDRFGLKREEIAVFGDGDNDVEMISFAGVGVAMGNGTPAARAAADFVTAAVDEDGLAKALCRLGLLDGAPADPV